MDLEGSIRTRIDTLLKGFLGVIAEEYDLDYESLCRFVETIDYKTGAVQDIQRCMHIFVRGKNKGGGCPSRALPNGFCGKHQSHAATFAGARAKMKPRTTETKTQQAIRAWMDTAVPKTETVLTRHDHGYLNEETNILFDEAYMVIGQLNNEAVDKLSKFEIEICERRGWRYHETAI